MFATIAWVMMPVPSPSTRYRSIVWISALLIIFGTIGCKDAGSEHGKVPQRTAADILNNLEKERSAGNPDSALNHARELVAAHSGTPEAAKAQAYIPALEAAQRRAEEERRGHAAQAAKEAEVQRLAEKWTYRFDDDPMTSRTAKYASIESENTVNFDFPYQGSQRGRLTLRDHPSYGRDVIFSIEQGQILCRSYEDCLIRIRFDEGEPQSWYAVGPADNSSTSIFLRNQQRFVQRLRAAKVVRLQVSVYQEGAPTFEFDVGGLNYARYSGGRSP
jgi:hypothetical protein